jgi:hypothetical protein
VTDNEDFWLDDDEQFLLTERGRELLATATRA